MKRIPTLVGGPLDGERVPDGAGAVLRVPLATMLSWRALFEGPQAAIYLRRLLHGPCGGEPVEFWAASPLGAEASAQLAWDRIVRDLPRSA